MKKYLLWAAGLFLLYRTLSSAKSPDGSDGFVVPPEWMVGADGHITYTLDINTWFNVGQRNVLKWSEKAMEWGVAMGMDPALIMGCIYSESSGNPDATRYEAKRNEYSYGLMQILWSTALDIISWLKAENYGIASSYTLTKFDIFIPNLNIMMGTRYLVKQYLRYSGKYGRDRIMAMFAAYNAGTAFQNDEAQYTNSVGNTSVNDYAVKCINAAQRFRFYLNNLYPAYLTMFPKEKWLYSGT
jgi:soluble lytic murein transglycosylase-like protein